MTTLLSDQQEKFAQALARGMSQAEAYREAYPTSVNWKENSVHCNASKLAGDAKIAQRVDEIRAPVLRKVRYELEDAMREANEAIVLAKEVGNPAALVAAVTLRARLNGLMTEDRKNDRRPLNEMNDEELQRLIGEAAREAGISVAPTLQ
jgi:phage terminase small subunit